MSYIHNYIYYLYSDLALHKLTERTQIQLIKNVQYHNIYNPNPNPTTISNNNNQVATVEEEVVVVQLYSFLSKLIFNASVAALFNSEAGFNIIYIYQYLYIKIIYQYYT